MPEYSQIQTYVKCNADHFREVLNKYGEMLLIMGFEPSFIADSFQDLQWEVDEDGFMYVGSNIKPVSLNFNDIILNIRPHIMGWTPKVLSKLKESWLEISLLFESEEITNDYSGKLIPAAERIIWDTLMIFSETFTETGVYFTNEVMDGLSWESLLGEADEIFAFDGAIIPTFLAKHYQDQPRDFISEVQNERLFFIRKSVWNEVPWD